MKGQTPMQMMMIFAIIHYACTDCDLIREKTAHSLYLEGAPLELAMDLQSVQHITSLEIILHLQPNWFCSWYVISICWFTFASCFLYCNWRVAYYPCKEKKVLHTWVKELYIYTVYCCNISIPPPQKGFFPKPRTPSWSYKVWRVCFHSLCSESHNHEKFQFNHSYHFPFPGIGMNG